MFATTTTTKKPTEGPIKADREAARALFRRGSPYTPSEIAVLDAGSPGPEEEVSTVIDRELQRTAMRRRVIAPSVDPEKEAIDRTVAAEFGKELEQAEQQVTAAAARLDAAHAAALAALPRVDPRDGWGHRLSIEDAPRPLREAYHTARRRADEELTQRANIIEKMNQRRWELAAAGMKR